MKRKSNRATEVLQTWRDKHGRVDLDAVRSGMVAVEHADDIRLALLDEVEQLRAFRDLARAVMEALDLPHPAEYPDAHDHREQLVGRAIVASASLRNALDNGWGPEGAAEALREWVAGHPVTYRTTGGVR